jgi:hypothetical protein
VTISAILFSRKITEKILNTFLLIDIIFIIYAIIIWIATFASSLAMTEVGVICEANTANLFAVSFPVVTAKH